MGPLWRANRRRVFARLHDCSDEGVLRASAAMRNFVLVLLCACGSTDSVVSPAGPLTFGPTGVTGKPTTTPTPSKPKTGATGPTASTGASASDTDGMHKRCQLLIDCGMSSFATADACMEAGMKFIGDCPKKLSATEAYATCMLDVDCGDQYAPASTPCGALWNAQNSSPCN